MSLFFDAAWFNARLAERGFDRESLAAAAGLTDRDLRLIFANERAPTAAELSALAGALGADLIEITLRAGVASRAQPGENDTLARIESIEARLDAMDAWLEEFEQQARARA